jgi:hypothetical protein
MDRSEASGVALSVVAHVALFGLLSLGFIASAAPLQIQSQPIEVTLTDQVALVSGAPDPSPEAPAARKSPVEAPIEPDSAPQPAIEPAKPQPAPPKDAIPDPSARRRPDRPSPAQQANARPGTRPVTPSGRLDGLDLNGPSDRPSTSTSTKQQASTMTPAAASNIASAIVQRTQPCADRQVSPAPEATRIRVTVTLRLNRDGSLAGPLTITAHDNVDDSNRRYVTRVDDAVRAIFAGCSPLRGLPPELYDVTNGWRVFTLRYKLKG